MLVMGDGTRAVQGPGERAAGPVVTPIVQSATFTLPSTSAIEDLYAGRRDDHVYTRYGNPTVDSAAARVAHLEGVESGLLAASGMAAIALVTMSLAGTGGRIVAVEDLYGGTAALLESVLPRLGITVDLVPTREPAALESALAIGPADLVYLESPTNPTLRLVPIRDAAAIARRHGVVSVIDSTFASPVNCRPAGLGVDLVLHSVTKYLSGHSDLIGGAVCGSAELVSRIAAVHRVTGAVMDPHAAFLLERGLKTLHVRMVRHNENALRLARLLEAHSKVARVHYPGLESHTQHALAIEQMPGGFGGVLAFDLDGGKDQAARFADSLRLFRNAASLGGVESLVSLPVVQSHRDASPETLRRSGIEPGTVRLAVGIEDFEDLAEDIDQALSKS
jgi:cystathionine gamma-synthase